MDFNGNVSLYSLSVTVGTGPDFSWAVTEKIKFTSLQFTFGILPTGNLNFLVQGAFLLDAETRLNPSLAAGYFGAGRGERAAAPDPLSSSAKPAALAANTAFDELAPEERPLAERQKICPVTSKQLGSMGTPEKYVIKDKDGEHPVFVCCGGCIKTIKKDEAKTLRDVEEMKKKNAEASPK